MGEAVRGLLIWVGERDTYEQAEWKVEAGEGESGELGVGFGCGRRVVGCISTNAVELWKGIGDCRLELRSRVRDAAN